MKAHGLVSAGPRIRKFSLDFDSRAKGSDGSDLLHTMGCMEANMSDKKRKRDTDQDGRPAKKPSAERTASEVKVKVLDGAAEASPVIGK